VRAASLDPCCSECSAEEDAWRFEQAERVTVKVEKDTDVVLRLDSGDGGTLLDSPSHRCGEVVDRDVEMLRGVLPVVDTWPRRPREVLFLYEVQGWPGPRW